MSHTALRRVTIRLLHDPTFAATLATDPTAVLDDAGLSDDERAWLLAVPAAAWRTDPERPRRVLAGLAEEYVASLALAASRGDTFFASRHFHRAVQERGSLAVALGRHLSEDADPRVAAVARLELAVATVRRAPRRVRPSPAGVVRLAPYACVVRVARGTDEILARLRAGGVPGPIAADDDTLLVVRADETLEVTIERLEEGVARVLAQARDPTSRSDLEALVVELGGDSDEATTLIDGFVAEAILI